MQEFRTGPPTEFGSWGEVGEFEVGVGGLWSDWSFAIQAPEGGYRSGGAVNRRSTARDTLLRRYPVTRYGAIRKDYAQLNRDGLDFRFVCGARFTAGTTAGSCDL